jgi:hypothetical protein
MGDLLQELLKKKQRETTGSDTNLRFDYQRNWAFCELIRRHIDGADYLAAFEFHDDVVFLEPSVSPQEAKFYQVKTTTKNQRTLGEFLGSKKPTTLAKMYSNFSGVCQVAFIETILVSNVPFAFGGYKICAKDLEHKFKKQLWEKLSSEIADFDEKKFANMHFLATGISLEAMRTYLIGQVNELFRANVGEDHGINLYAWTRAVQDEINRRNNHPSDQITEIQELISKKCIGRDFIDGRISDANRPKASPLNFTLVSTELGAAGWNTTQLMKIEKQIPRALADYTDPSNNEAAALRVRLNRLLASAGNAVLATFLLAAVSDRIQLTEGLAPYSDASYFEAFAVILFHDQL